MSNDMLESVRDSLVKRPLIMRLISYLIPVLTIVNGFFMCVYEDLGREGYSHRWYLVFPAIQGGLFFIFICCRVLAGKKYIVESILLGLLLAFLSLLVVSPCLANYRRFTPRDPLDYPPPSMIQEQNDSLRHSCKGGNPVAFC